MNNTIVVVTMVTLANSFETMNNVLMTCLYLIVILGIEYKNVTQGQGVWCGWLVRLWLDHIESILLLITTIVVI